MAAPPPPTASAAMFARLSASRPPRQAISAFAGGALDTTILSTCQDTLLSFFTTRTVLPLRAACRDARAAIARRGWEDLDTAILGSLTAWAACFPAARAGNAGGRVRAHAPSVTAEEWASLRGLREPATGAPSLQELLLLGAGEGLAAAARDALPGVRTAAALTGVCIARLNKRESATGLAVLDTGLLVSGAMGSTTLRLWNAATGKSEGSIDGGRGGKIAALPGGRFAIAGYFDATASVWDAVSRTRVCELQGHTGYVYCVAALPGGLVATGSKDCTVRLWTAATGAPVATLQHGGPVVALALLPDGRLVSCGGGNIRLWDLSTRTCTAEWNADGSFTPASLAALQGGRLASGSVWGGVHLWNTASGVREASLGGHKAGVYALAALPCGLLASGSGDITVRVWSVAARACVAVLQGHTAGVSLPSTPSELAALPDGRLLVACSGRDGNGQICMWELRDAEVGEQEP
jgi:WD40 repeat protein